MGHQHIHHLSLFLLFQLLYTTSHNKEVASCPSEAVGVHFFQKGFAEDAAHSGRFPYSNRPTTEFKIQTSHVLTLDKEVKVPPLIKSN
jgi:hypothetical protein